MCVCARWIADSFTHPNLMLIVRCLQAEAGPWSRPVSSILNTINMTYDTGQDKAHKEDMKNANLTSPYIKPALLSVY